ncbi:hypothetical protein KVT40_000853 [Elsinoe batatas]|uniref:Uncharacterized protein n=1 Tax=Elsinoe batatas TaxID=2601811 RepID=A0A8K0LBQ7_9PEZI|nr:hypothetical protein KVT40_000853 [Elsinoe batatas]
MVLTRKLLTSNCITTSRALYRRFSSFTPAVSHLAATQEASKAPFVIKAVPTPAPAEDEILIRNELIGLIPVDMKMAKYGTPPIASYQRSWATALAVYCREQINRYWQQSRSIPAVCVGESQIPYAAKVSGDADLHGPVGTIGNITTIVAMLSQYMGLQRPDFSRLSSKNGQKILVYGGTSSVGFLATQYLVQAGYDVVTTTSPKNWSLVSILGQPETTNITGVVLHAQDGGKLYTLLPPMGPETIPETVERVFQPYATALMEEKNADSRNWAVLGYYQQALERGKLAHLPTTKVPGGLAALNDACDILERGVSAAKVVVDPWE